VSVYRDIYDEIRATQDAERGPVYRLLKVQEEAGEVAQAVIGFAGANKRKGVTHSETDVAKELCDVVISAMVALHDWDPNPELLLLRHLGVLTERIEKEGS
jgi:NTP pyrophosphatase (non-canonical NTP hydrolase)